MELKEYIIEKSKNLSIDIIGFTDAEPLTNLEEYLRFRVDNNIATEFEEKDILKRIDPKLTFPDCKSIIVIGISYNVDYKEKIDDNEVRGIISKSSWGTDYHRVLKQKLEDLIIEIKKVKDFNYKYFVDTGPLVDRELAYKAGIGYYGKNCSIINPEYGSFIFLGYILCDLEIPKDNPIPNECCDCELCLKACPTGALASPFKLNAKKCISYLTQTKNIIEEDLRDKMGTKVYGCDTCQLVCPKNRHVSSSSYTEFIPKHSTIDIRALFNMSNKEFKKTYGHMAGSWRGKNILKRNAIIALGNMKNIKNIELLRGVLEEDNSNLNTYALWALKKIYLHNKK